MRRITKLTREQIASFATPNLGEIALNQRVIKYFEGLQETVAETPAAVDALERSVDASIAIAMQALSLAKKALATNIPFSQQRGRHE